MKILPNLFAVCLLLCGCAAPTRLIKFDSEPRGARIFLTIGADENMAKGARNFLGMTPFTWTTEVNGDGTFKVEHAAIPVFSDFIQSVAVFTAEPPSGQTNLFTKREVYRGNAAYQRGNKVPEGIFFDLTKP
jgi:hypothetical protein